MFIGVLLGIFGVQWGLVGFIGVFFGFIRVKRCMYFVYMKNLFCYVERYLIYMILKKKIFDV